MIDIHAHILPGLDDGAGNRDEACAMLKMAVAAGTTDIVASPHANSDFVYDPAEVSREIAALQQAVGDSIRIHYGCEVHLTIENLQAALSAPVDYSIDHNGYLLVEFSDFFIPNAMPDIFARILGAGLRPIIVHPERNPVLQVNTSWLEAWVRLGCRIQITARSVTGGFGKVVKAGSGDLIRRGLVHFVASDAHNIAGRSPALDEAWQHIAAEYGEAAAIALLEENPRAALTGADLPRAAFEIRKKRRFFL